MIQIQIQIKLKQKIKLKNLKTQNVIRLKAYFFNQPALPFICLSQNLHFFGWSCYLPCRSPSESVERNDGFPWHGNIAIGNKP